MRAPNSREADKTELKKLNEEFSTLSDAFNTKLLAATKAGAYVPPTRPRWPALATPRSAAAAAGREGPQGEGLRDSAAEHDAAARSWRPERTAQRGKTIFENSWNRAEHGDANDTRDTIARLAQLRAQKAQAARVSQLRRLEARRSDGEDPGSGAEVHGRAGAGGHGQGGQRKPRTSRR